MTEPRKLELFQLVATNYDTPPPFKWLIWEPGRAYTDDAVWFDDEAEARHYLENGEPR